MEEETEEEETKGRDRKSLRRKRGLDLVEVVQGAHQMAGEQGRKKGKGEKKEERKRREKVVKLGVSGKMGLSLFFVMTF